MKDGLFIRTVAKLMGRENRLKLKQLHDGEWERPVHKGYRLQCCRCGVEHLVDFRVRKGAVEFRATSVVATEGDLKLKKDDWLYCPRTREIFQVGRVAK
jgi:hypothetical protein